MQTDVETPMTRRITLAAALLSAIWGVAAWSQNQSKAQGGDDGAPRTRTQPMWAETSEPTRTAVTSPVKQMQVARLIFVGTPVLPLSLQDQIAKSLSVIDYEDNTDGRNELLERVRDAWQEQGYFQAKVEQSGSQTLEEAPERRTVAITVNVGAGKQYRLGRIHFTGTVSSNVSRSDPAVPRRPEQQGRFSREQLRSFFPIQQGDIFDTHKLQMGVEELRKAFGENGFINFSDLPNFEIDEASSTITVVMELEEGRQFHVGNVQAKGLDRATANWLFQSAGLVSGKVFSTSLLEASLKQVQSSLPTGICAEDDFERRLHEESATVDLLFRFKDCQLLDQN